MGNLFVSTAERNRRQEAAHRMARREAERARKSLERDIEELRDERNRCTTEAKRLVRTGDEAGARYKLADLQSIDAQIAGRERRVRIMQHQMRDFDLVRGDQRAILALSSMGAFNTPQPERLDRVFDMLAGKAENLHDVEQSWTNAYDEQLGEAGSDARSRLDIDQMLKNLQDEVANEIEAENSRAAGDASTLAAELEAEHKQLNTLVEKL